MNELNEQQRREKYVELCGKLPVDGVRQRLDWLVENLHCTRTTARIWNMANTSRPMPAAKLRIMEDKLKATQ